KPFTGDSQASLFNAILKDDPPPISAIHADTPPLLDYIIRRCLAKDPDERWQTASDLIRDLKWIAEHPSPDATVASAFVMPLRRTFAWMIAGGALAVTSLAVGVALYIRPPADPRPIIRFEYQVSAGINRLNGGRTLVAFSPDGSHFVYNGPGGL